MDRRDFLRSAGFAAAGLAAALAAMHGRADQGRGNPEDADPMPGAEFP